MKTRGIHYLKKKLRVDVLIAILVVFLAFLLIQMMERLFHIPTGNSTFGFWLVSVFALVSLVFRLFLEGNATSEYFTYRKIGLSNKKIAKIFLIVTQINTHNLCFFLLGVGLIWKWQSPWLFSLLFILVLCTNIIDKLVKQLYIKYDIVGFAYCTLLAGLFVLTLNVNNFNKIVSLFSPTEILLLVLMVFLLLNFIGYKVVKYTFDYEYSGIKKSELWIARELTNKLTYAWIQVTTLLLLRVPRIKGLWIGFFFLLIAYGSVQFRGDQSASMLNFLQTFIYMVFLTAFYGQKFLSWDSSYISFVLSNSDSSGLYDYIKSKYYTLCILTTISYLFIFLITFFSNATNEILIEVSVLYLYCLSSLPILFIIIGTRNKLKIDLKQKSMMAHWRDGSSIPSLSFFLYYGISSALYMLFYIFDLVIFYYYLLVFVSLLLILFHLKIIRYIGRQMEAKKKEIYYRFNY
ncbi:MAG: hypothetical protein KIT80_23075 [Chitinophagaceae bacterium]|nr:hypothetical protein [Chitinophagaceae bacterium]MCW5929822.1 hypothetical protein [Chitinophagaceae bacterium]